MQSTIGGKDKSITYIASHEWGKHVDIYALK